jgi:phosphoglycolate phosphatase-like HAD superfamily hydrolase
MFDLLRERKEIIESGIKLPELKSMEKFMSSGVALGNPELEKAVKETGDIELAFILKWSMDVNTLVKQTVKNIPPFPWVRESFDKIIKNSDMICVSQTPAEALIREWEENDLIKYPRIIAGQELGTKAEHIAFATKDKYNPDKMLMIGDALGDMEAAKENKAHFYPINPVHESASWERFYQEAYDKFLAGTYDSKYEQALIAEFKALLPEKPTWGK